MQHKFKRQEIFDSFVNECDLFRPRYPQEFARIISDRVGIRTPSTILEIGCGSGQATEAFAKLGCLIDALQ